MATEISATLLPIFVILIVWSLIWKGIALWKAGRNNQLAWFIIILILNTAGILPILYIFFFQPKRKPVIRPAAKPVRRKRKK